MPHHERVTWTVANTSLKRCLKHAYREHGWDFLMADIEHPVCNTINGPTRCWILTRWTYATWWVSNMVFRFIILIGFLTCIGTLILTAKGLVR